MVVGWGSSFFGATPARRPYACRARMVFRETRPSSLLFLPFEKGFWFWIYIVFTCIFSDFRVHPYAPFLHFLALLCVSCKRWVLVLSYVIVFSILLRDATSSMSKCIIPSVHLFWTCIQKVYYYGYLVYCDYFNSIVGARKCSFFLVSLCFLCESPIPMVMAMRGMISHPSALIASNSGSYLSCFVLMPWSMYHNFRQPIVYVLFTIKGRLGKSLLHAQLILDNT
jgi:hypothetical protein